MWTSAGQHWRRELCVQTWTENRKKKTKRNYKMLVCQASYICLPMSLLISVWVSVTLAFSSGASSLHCINGTACMRLLRSRSHSAGHSAVGVRRLFCGRLPFQKCPCSPIATRVLLKSQRPSAFTPCFRTFPVHLRHTKREATERCSHVVSCVWIPADSEPRELANMNQTLCKVNGIDLLPC